MNGAVVDTRTGEILPLTAMERSALTHAEATIERGLTSFIEVGEALAKVRDEQLYRDDFGTFEAYCRDRWGITDRRARQMIDAAEITNSLPTGTTVPVNEGQARELTGLDPEAAADTMRKASEATGGRPTAAAIRAARTPEPADLGEGDAGSGQHSTEASPADDVDTQAAPAEDEAPGATSDDATAASPEREGFRAPGHNLRPAPAADDEFTEQDRAEELAGNLARNLSLLYAVTNPDRRAEYIAAWVPGTRSRPTLGQNFVTPRHMRALAEALQTFATEWEHAHA